MVKQSKLLKKLVQEIGILQLQEDTGIARNGDWQGSNGRETVLKNYFVKCKQFIKVITITNFLRQIV